MTKNTYYSQYGQDKLLKEVFFGKKKMGRFLDIGAHDGKTFSNTYFFEKHYKWSGVCVEPIPEVFEKLKQNRKCVSVNACVDKENGIVKFTRVSGYGEMLSGISKEYDNRHIQRIKETLGKFGGKAEEIEVPALSPSQLIADHDLKHIDLMNLDTEGNELNIIQSFPFDRIQPKLILVENNYNSHEVRSYLQKSGYTFLIHQGDDFFYYGKLTLDKIIRLTYYKLKRSVKYRLKKLRRKLNPRD